MRNKINLPTFIFNQYITKNNVPPVYMHPSRLGSCDPSCMARMSTTLANAVAETMSCGMVIVGVFRAPATRPTA